MKQMYKFSESSKSRMEKFEESHAAREPQVGHPCTITFCLLPTLKMKSKYKDVFKFQNRSGSWYARCRAIVGTFCNAVDQVAM